MKTANRRESPRIDVQLRCHITSPAAWLQSAAFTENISRCGVLIGLGGEAAGVPPRVGQILTVEIDLPADHGFGQKCIHCQGTVVRVAQPEDRGVRVALRVNYMDFRSVHDRLRMLEAIQPIVQSRMA